MFTLFSICFETVNFVLLFTLIKGAPTELWSQISREYEKSDRNAPKR